MAPISDRASNAPMPKPPGLLEANGWNSRLRTKSPSMPTPLSAMLIATVESLLDTRTVTGTVGRAGFDRVLEQVAERLLQRDAVGQRPKAGVAEQPHLMIAALGRDRRGQDRPQRLRLERAGRWRRRAATGGRADRSSCRPIPSAWRSCRSGIRDCRRAARRCATSKDNWLTRFLMSCRMKAKRRLNSSNRCALDKASWPCASASELAAWRPAARKQVEILPVERTAVIGRGEQDDPDQPVVVDQRDPGPQARGLRASSRAPGALLSAASAQPWRKPSNSMIRPLFSIAVQKFVSSLDLARGRDRSGPVPRRRDPDRPAGVADQQQAARRVDDIGEGLDDPIAERRRVGADAAERIGKAKPFGAIVVAVLEQMLGELDLEPAARPRRYRHGARRR